MKNICKSFTLPLKINYAKHSNKLGIEMKKCCMHNCNQGRDCPNSYQANFDHLGNPVDQTPPFRISDLIIICIAVLGTVALLSGVV